MKKTIIFDNADNVITQNFLLRDEKLYKVPGTDYYNETNLNNKIRWLRRYYGLNADGTQTKHMLVAEDDKLYLGDDVSGSLTEVYSGLSRKGIPEDLIIQVSGRSRMFFFNGYDIPIYHDGESDGTWYQSSLDDYKFVQCEAHHQRMWGFVRNSSRVYFSRVLYPEDFSATYGGNVRCGNEKDSFIRRIMRLGRYIYVFKNDSIWRIEGNSQATYSPQVVIPDRGLIAQQAIGYVGSAIVFVCQQDKEVYEFNGSASPKRLTSVKNPFADKLDLTSTDTITCIEDTKNKLFRISYKNKRVETAYNNHEFCFSTNELGEDGLPKWFDTLGAKISCYDMWNRQGDDTLVTGRIDIGRIMYHNRGYDWDDTAMECKCRLFRLTPKDGHNSQFDAVMIKGTPSTGTFTLRTFLNDRLENDGTKSSQSVDDTGETTAIGEISLPVQSRFNSYLPLLTGYNFGENIGIEIFDETLAKEIMIEHLVLYYTPREKIVSSLVG